MLYFSGSISRNQNIQDVLYQYVRTVVHVLHAVIFFVLAEKTLSDPINMPDVWYKS